MPKVEINKTELVWPGKFNADGNRKDVPRVTLPFQIIETVNENQSARKSEKNGAQATLFDIYTGDEGDGFDDGWKNKLIWGDNLQVMSSLLDKFAGKIDVIYIDPPFGTGADFTFSTTIGESREGITQGRTIVEEKAYRDTWGKGKDSWFEMIYDRLRLIRELLGDHGTLYLHLDWYLGHHMKPVIDDVFGEHNSLGEIVWAYGSPSGGRVSGSKLVKSHDIIYVVAKNYGKHKYNQVFLPYSEKYVKDWFKHVDEDGRRYRKRQRRNRDTGEIYWERQYLDRSKGVPVSTVWTDIQQIYADPRAFKAGTKSEITGYATQKPEKLLERMIKISSDPDDLVADFFCGSGTALAAAENLGRRWIGCDMGRWGVHITRKRLLDIPKCKPFEVLNLGKYERQYWQSAAFAGAGKEPPAERALYEYLAFILKLYGAQPISGLEHVHGKKDKALVRIGSVDAPVTIDEIDGALNECVRLKQRELHVLGWEWEMGVAGSAGRTDGGGPMLSLARSRGVDLVLLQIPREVMEQQAVDRGDVRFFELAYLDARLDMSGRSATVTLSDFVIPNPELVPDGLRRKVGAWSDFIDYWAVDWDFRNDTFMQGWVAYRTRKDRALPLSTTNHSYERPGRYRVLIKVIDIFGNDTSRLLDAKAV